MSCAFSLSLAGAAPLALALFGLFAEPVPAPVTGQAPTTGSPATGSPEGQDTAGAGHASSGLVYPDAPPGLPAARTVEGASAASEAEMRAYVEPIPGTAATFRMVPIAGGTFRMGSPEGEDGHHESEGPQVDVRLSPFWMGATEVTWDEYHQFMYRLDLQARAKGEAEAQPEDAWADAVSRPTPPYVPMDFEMGVTGRPAICMTHFAARQYTKWLSMKTGRFYRLPTEAEWEYACRAGTETAYWWGDDPADAEGKAWWFDNSEDGYHPVGQTAPNPWGLYDMHGNVWEWCLDAFDAKGFAALAEEAKAADAGPLVDPVTWPTALYPRTARGGSWDDDLDRLRSAARRGSSKTWKVQDPQLPKSIWYHTDATFLGFRVVRPLTPPPAAEWARYWDADLDEVRAIQERQRHGGR
ncbi:MAG: formylglycine-generating enzyme family protein [Planctomycetota bacterium]